MKNKFLIYILLGGILMTLSSCLKDDDKIDEKWKTDNIKAFQDKGLDANYKKIEVEDLQMPIYYKVLKSGESTKKPYFNSLVAVYYEGKLIDGTVFDTNKNVSTPFRFKVYDETGRGNVIEGWRTVLQYMNEGDEWEVWIPYQLAYGNLSKGVIPAYSTLIFNIHLVKIIQE